MTDLSTWTALVTGASSGIGKDMAEALAQRGLGRIVLTARREQALNGLAQALAAKHSIETEVIVADLATNGVEVIVNKLAERGIEIDLLINNAGFGQRGAFAELDHDQQMSMVAVNVSALTSLSHHLLPSMLARQRGGILNVASVAAFVAGPNMAVYYATKAFVLSFSEALAEEVAKQGVKVMALCPGATATGFADTANLAGSKLFALGVMSSQDVARDGIQAWLDGHVVRVSGMRNKLTALSTKLVPRAISRQLAAKLQS